MLTRTGIRKNACGLAAIVGLSVAPGAWTHAGNPSLEAYRQHWGGHANFRLGWSSAGIGDINADGIDEYIIGAIPDNPTAGYAIMYSGASGLPLVEAYGQNFLDMFGWSVAPAGDVNNDGTPDAIIGAMLHFVFEADDAYLGGRAYVVSGATGLVIRTFEGQTDELLGWSVAGAGNVDGDDHDDVIVGSPIYNDKGKATVFSGATGAPLYIFEHPTAWLVGTSVAGLGDVNGDGYDDVAVGAMHQARAFILDAHNGVVLHTLTGPSGFGKSMASAGDLNGDGVNEIMIGAAARTFVFNSASGSTMFEFGDFGHAVAGGRDLNNDGTPDLAIGGPGAYGTGGNGRVEVRSGTDASLIRILKGFPQVFDFGYSVAMIGDVNLDDSDDLLVGSSTFKPVSGMANYGAAYIYCGFENLTGFSGPGNVAGANEPAGGIVSADFDGDGLPDVATVSENTDTLRVYMNSNGSLGEPVSFATGKAPSAIAAVKLNADAHVDLVVALAGEDKIMFFLNDGDGGFVPAGKLNTGKKPVSIIARQITGYGYVDIAVVNAKGHSVSYFRGQYATNAKPVKDRFMPKIDFPVKPGPSRMAAGDLNGDGMLDLAVLSAGAKRITQLRNTGDTFGQKKHTNVGESTIDITLADFNDDGFADLAYVGKSADVVRVRLSGPNGAFGPSASYAVGAKPRAVVAADLNLDGRPDLITANWGDSSISVLYADSNGQFQPAMHFATLGSPRFLIQADLDGDEDPDIITLDKNSGAISGMENLWFQ